MGASGAAKWREASEAGFQIVPDVLFRSQSKLGLDAADVVILLNIGMHWWQENELPYPVPATIARRMGVTTRAVEKRLVSLADRGFLSRQPRERKGSDEGRSIRRFDLSGLVEKLRPLAEANLAMRPIAATTGIELDADMKPAP